MSNKQSKQMAPQAEQQGAKKIPGSELAYDVQGKRSSLGITTQAYYWVGLLPDCPKEFAELAGTSFPKTTATLQKESASGRTVHVPRFGTVTSLTEEQINLMRDKLSRTVIRFRQPTRDPLERANVGDITERRTGHFITVPTEAEIEERRKAKRAAMRYTPQANDEPAADYMFAVLCEDQDKPRCGDYYPEPLSKTGLEWPGK
jgi:hypothetical protein